MQKIIDFFKNNKVYIIVFAVMLIVIIGLIIAVCLLSSQKSVMTGGNPFDEISLQTEPENQIIESPETEDAYVPFEKRSNGIDVSKWQGQIDWKKVKESGIHFAFIRVGYRGGNGKVYEDEYAAYNLQQAEANGILIGVYFFSTAINKEEALEEAEWVLDYIEGYSISYPVVYDCEGFTEPDSRMYELTAEQRTDNALTFLDKISEYGYETMHYGARNELESEECWNIKLIERYHKVWVAMYTNIKYPYKDKPTYTGRCDAWQFSDKGSIDGINTDVDLVVCYFVREKAEPRNPDKDIPYITIEDMPQVDEIVHGVRFYNHNDKVTAKILVNLREYPSATDDCVVGELKNGEYLQRTGISDQGWSRLIYNGEIVYAVSSYLLTEDNLEGDDSVYEQYYFDSVNDLVTAKIETNLRTAPTTSGSEVVYTLKNGEYIKRTGLNLSTGWSMLEYNGQTVYAVSSYLEVQNNIE